MSNFKVVTRAHRAQLAEGPVWSARENALYWIDIMAPAVHRLSLVSGGMSSWPMPEMIGWIAERASRPGFIAGFASGFAELQLEPLSIRPLGDPEPELENSRMNDAKVDPKGRIWAGTMAIDAATPVGALYRLDPDCRWTKQDEGYLVTNGPTFSPDGKYLYHTESVRGIVYRFDLRADGTLSNKTPWVTFPQSWGYPDGMTTDVEGGIWVGHFGGGRVSRFSAEGQLDRAIELPASQITSCCFAGERLERMFVTSAGCDKPSEELAGELFEIDPGVCGMPTTRFAG